MQQISVAMQHVLQQNATHFVLHPCCIATRRIRTMLIYRDSQNATRVAMQHAQNVLQKFKPMVCNLYTNHIRTYMVLYQSNFKPLMPLVF